MKKIITSLALTLLMCLCLYGQSTPKPTETKLKVGDIAPDFELTDTTLGKQLDLAITKVRKMWFKPFMCAFTSSLTKELKAY
jgi:hypothetical protein